MSVSLTVARGYTSHQERVLDPTLAKTLADAFRSFDQEAGSVSVAVGPEVVSTSLRITHQHRHLDLHLILSSEGKLLINDVTKQGMVDVGILRGIVSRVSAPSDQMHRSYG